jgi:hypothetical protein
MRQNRGNLKNILYSVGVDRCVNPNTRCVNPNIIKIVLILLFTSITLRAEDFTHNFTINKTQPYIKEGVLLTLELKQTNRDVVLLFSFDLEKSKNYTFRRVDIKEEDRYHSAYLKYSYLIYPLKSGNIDLNFKLQKRATTDDSIAYSYSGDRDNVRGLFTTDSDIKLSPITLNVKPLPNNTQLVGDFKMVSKFKTHQAKAYQAIPFEINIKGHGYPPLLQNIIKDGNVTLFKEQPTIKSIATTNGTENSITYAMALSHSQSFTLKQQQIEAFNPKTKKSYILTIPQQEFKIDKVAVEELIDKTDTPKPIKSDFSWLSTLFSYLIVFIAGYFTALSIKWNIRTKRVDNNLFKTKVKGCKDAKELLQLLLATNNQKFKEKIEKLEKIIYGGAKYTFKDIQKELVD